MTPEPEPEPDPPTPPTPTTVPCALVLHVTTSGGYEDDVAIQNGYLSYIPPGGTEPIDLQTFQRDANTGNAVQITGWGLPEGSTVLVTGDLVTPGGVTIYGAELQTAATGPRNVTLPVTDPTDSKTFLTGSQPYNVVEMPESEQYVVYGWLLYINYTVE